MKMMLFAFVMLSGTAFAATTTPVQDCFKITDSLDRKYCMDKYLQSVKTNLAAEEKTWVNGIDAKTKADKQTALDQDIQAKKEYMTVIQEEINLNQKHLDDLKNAKVATVEVKHEKKKKKHSGFRIKL